MKNPKRQHFVPRAYLETFTDSDGFLHLYSKGSDLWYRQKPIKAFVRSKYYRQEWAPDGTDPNILERKLGEDFEPKGLATLKKLVTCPESLTDDDTAFMLTYLQFQRIRVPRQGDKAKEAAKNVLTSLVAQTPKGREALKYVRINVKDSFRFEYMKTAHGVFSPYFARMVWHVIQAPEGSFFVTSDSPVTFLNEKFYPPLEPGIALYGTVVVYPISSKYILMMRHPEFETGEKAADDALPKNLPLKDGVIEIRTNLIMTQEEVNKQNWFMYVLCQDLIVGVSKRVLEDTIGK